MSALAFGTCAFGGDWGAFDDQEARGAIKAALDAGITLFDTARAYGFGVAERLQGQALLRRTKRENVIIATKGGLRPDGGCLRCDAGARWLREGVESSLRNLGTDYIDLYQVHWPDASTPAQETAGVLGSKRYSRLTTCSIGTSKRRSCPSSGWPGRSPTLRCTWR